MLTSCEERALETPCSLSACYVPGTGLGLREIKPGVFPSRSPESSQQRGQKTGPQVLGRDARAMTPALARGRRVLLPKDGRSLAGGCRLVLGCHVTPASAGTGTQVAGGGESPALPPTPKPLKQTLSGGALNLQQPLPPAPGSAGTPALPGAAAASSAALGRTTPAPPPPTAGSCEGLGRWSLLGKPPRPPLVPVPLSLHFRLLCLTFYFAITSDAQKMCKDDTRAHVPFVQPPLLSAPYVVVELAKLSPVTRCHRRN